MNDSYKICFIIAHKYIRGYESYLSYYISNINKFYEGALIIIVDNNSKYKDDIFSKITDTNVIFLNNDIECKFELGAYQVGLNYILTNNLNIYNYYIFIQDNFVLKNKYDFNNLIKNDVTACPINSYFYDVSGPRMADICKDILTKLNLYDHLNDITFCWCVSFIVHTSKIEQLYLYIKDIIITTRVESEASERYLARILYELNDHKNFDIDGDIRQLNQFYDCWKVNFYNEYKTYFVKKVQQKNEKTLDL